MLATMQWWLFAFYKALISLKKMLETSYFVHSNKQIVEQLEFFNFGMTSLVERKKYNSNQFYSRYKINIV